MGRAGRRGRCLCCGRPCGHPFPPVRVGRSGGGARVGPGAGTTGSGGGGRDDLLSAVRVVAGGISPGSAATVARYGVEAIGVALFAVALVSRRAERNRWGAIALPVAAVLVTWGLAALFAGVSPSTALIGFRAELRWLLVGLVVALTYDRALDTRWYGRAVVGAAALQSCIALSASGPAAPRCRRCSHPTIRS